MKYIGLDLGSVTCGISKSETGKIAEALKTIRFEKDNYDMALEKVEEFIAEYKPDVVVLKMVMQVKEQNCQKNLKIFLKKIQN